MSYLFLAGLWVYSLDSLNVGRSRHIVNNSVKQRLNALVSVRCAAGDRNHFIGYCRLTDYLLYLLNRRLLALEVFFHELLVLLDNMLYKLGAVLVGKLDHILRDRLVPYVLAEIVVINFSVHIYKVNNALECVLRADRQLNRNAVAVETLFDHIKNVIEIRAHYIHLVYIDHSGYVILVSLSPNGFRLRFNTALGAENGNRSVQHAQ